jgi:hypothetical protein
MTALGRPRTRRVCRARGARDRTACFEFSLGRESLLEQIRETRVVACKSDVVGRAADAECGEAHALVVAERRTLWRLWRGGSPGLSPRRGEHRHCHERHECAKEYAFPSGRYEGRHQVIRSSGDQVRHQTIFPHFLVSILVQASLIPKGRTVSAWSIASFDRTGPVRNYQALAEPAPARKVSENATIPR